MRRAFSNRREAVAEIVAAKATGAHKCAKPDRSRRRKTGNKISPSHGGDLTRNCDKARLESGSGAM